MEMHPKKMAAAFKISSSTLRNYEANGLIPPTQRSANGYRVYTGLHADYLECIQAMAPAFGMVTTTEVLHSVQRNEVHSALWTVREKEVALYEEKGKVERLIEDIRLQASGNQSSYAKERFTIGEVSELTKAPESAIRYWEQAGYVLADRDPANRYRLYGPAHLLKIGLMQALQSTVYSEDTVVLRQSIASADHADLPRILKLAEAIRSYLDKSVEAQMGGIASLHKLVLRQKSR